MVVLINDAFDDVKLFIDAVVTFSIEPLAFDQERFEVLANPLAFMFVPTALVN